VRNAPHSGETAGLSPLICPTTEAEYFSREGWTRQISLIWLAKIDFWRMEFSSHDLLFSLTAFALIVEENRKEATLIFRSPRGSRTEPSSKPASV
jgi:hypothetical protein